MSDNSQTTVITPTCRVSFANVFVPQAPLQPGSEPKYGMTLLFEKDADIAALKAAAGAAATAKWGDKIPSGMRSPFRDQGEKSDFEGYEPGCIFINATGRMKPGLVNQRNEPIIDPEEFYSGCYARAQVNAFAYDKAGNKGVAFGLNNVQKVREGDPLGSRERAEDVFSPVEDIDTNTAAADSIFG